MSARQYVSQLTKLETPYYFYDMQLLHDTLTRAVSEASKYGYKIHYALKANFDPRIVSAALQAGLGVDCVSGNEVRTAIESGCPASKIVFAGVAKSDREIRYALEQNIFAFNCESLQELQVINALAAEMGRTAHVALRINPDVDPHTHQNISTGHADSKFGISYTEIDEAIRTLHTLPNLRIVGLHFHIGSQIRQMEVFENFCLKVNTIKQWFADQGVEVQYLNLGGGLGVDYEDPDAEPIPDFASYFGTIHRTLKPAPHQQVLFELGRSLVAQCGELITRVLYTKKNASGRDVALVDAGMTDLIRPALYQAHHKIECLTAQGSECSYMVGGPVCESSDIFDKTAMLPKLKRGDLLAIRTAGAYGSAMASRYNLRDLPRSVYSDEL